MSQEGIAASSVEVRVELGSERMVMGFLNSLCRLGRHGD